MKLVTIIVLIMTFSFGYSQNKNIKEETKTTITTVDNGQGEKQTIKNETTKNQFQSSRFSKVNPTF